MTLWIKELRLKNFRSYEAAAFRFDAHLNCILGGNAQGKTNLLEALYFLSSGRSFRTPHLKHLIKEGATAFLIEALYERDGVTQELKLSFNGVKKEFLHNKTPCSSSTELFGLVPITLYSPEDVQLISGPPAKRRRFLDMHIALSNPLYLNALIRYYRAMKQRNALLKSENQESIEIWEQQMALSGVALMHTRSQCLGSLLPYLKRTLHTLSDGGDAISWNYKASLQADDVQAAVERFAAYRTKEVCMGSTLIGPHKDDIELMLSQKEAKIYASEGQKRTLALALRLAEWHRLQDQLQLKPVICLDDFGSHLDIRRQTLLLQQLPTFGQVFLTSPTPLPELAAQGARTLHISIK